MKKVKLIGMPFQSSVAKLIEAGASEVILAYQSDDPARIILMKMDDDHIKILVIQKETFDSGEGPRIVKYIDKPRYNIGLFRRYIDESENNVREYKAYYISDKLLWGRDRRKLRLAISDEILEETKEGLLLVYFDNESNKPSKKKKSNTESKTEETNPNVITPEELDKALREAKPVIETCDITDDPGYYKNAAKLSGISEREMLERMLTDTDSSKTIKSINPEDYGFTVKDIEDAYKAEGIPEGNMTSYQLIRAIKERDAKLVEMLKSKNVALVQQALDEIKSKGLNQEQIRTRYTSLIVFEAKEFLYNNKADNTKEEK